MPPKTPSQYELWADLATQNKHLRRNNLIHWIFHLVLLVSLFLTLNRPLMAVRVDHLGRADLASTASATASEPGPEEAQQVARTVSQYLLEVTSGSVARDLSKATALMTSKFQRAYLDQVQQDKTLPLLEKGNIRTALVFDDTAVEIKAERDDRGALIHYFVTLNGTLNVYRADVLTAPLLTRPVVIRVTLLAVPRSSRTLNGLLVDFFEKEVVETQKTTQLSVNPLPVAPAAATAPGGTP